MAVQHGPASEQGQRILRALKAWLLAGASFETKAQHQMAGSEEVSSETLEAWLSALGDVPDRPYGRS